MLRIISFFLLICFTQEGLSQKHYSKAIRQYRKAYKKEFRETDNSPLSKRATRKLRFFKPDATYRVIAKLERTPEAKAFEMATISGEPQPYVQYAKASFELDGAIHSLSIYRSINLSRMPMYRTSIFLPFKDGTNGESTYGGGRYLSLDAKNIKNGYLDIDFNKAYNPYCVYSDGYSCPIPPAENHLSVLIKAGEKNYPKDN